jgi:hypothetical protein
MGPEYDLNMGEEYHYPPKTTCLDCGAKFFVGDEWEPIPFCYNSTCRNSLTFHVWKLKNRE